MGGGCGKACGCHDAFPDTRQNARQSEWRWRWMDYSNVHPNVYVYANVYTYDNVYAHYGCAYT